MPPEKSLGIRWDSLKFSLPSLLLLIMLSHQYLAWSYPELSRFSIVPSSFPIKCGERQHCLPSPFWFLTNIALPITAWTCDKARRLPATAINGHQYDYYFGFLWIAGSAILVIPQTQNNQIMLAEKYPDSREKRLHGKTFRIQKFSESKFPL